MISRIRLDAYGATAADVEGDLQALAADLCELAVKNDTEGIFEKVGPPLAPDGEMVIERQLAEPHGCDYAYKGRLTLHPTVDPPAFGKRHDSYFAGRDVHVHVRDCACDSGPQPVSSGPQPVRPDPTQREPG